MGRAEFVPCIAIARISGTNSFPNSRPAFWVFDRQSSNNSVSDSLRQNLWPLAHSLGKNPNCSGRFSCGAAQ